MQRIAAEELSHRLSTLSFTRAGASDHPAATKHDRSTAAHQRNIAANEHSSYGPARPLIATIRPRGPEPHGKPSTMWNRAVYFCQPPLTVAPRARLPRLGQSDRLHCPVSASGGIGIRSGFRCRRLRSWGFESPLAHTLFRVSVARVGHHVTTTANSAARAESRKGWRARRAFPSSQRATGRPGRRGPREGAAARRSVEQ